MSKDNGYVMFGETWQKEMMQWKKRELILLLRAALIDKIRFDEILKNLPSVEARTLVPNEGKKEVCAMCNEEKILHSENLCEECFDSLP